MKLRKKAGQAYSFYSARIAFSIFQVGATVSQFWEKRERAFEAPWVQLQKMKWLPGSNIENKAITSCQEVGLLGLCRATIRRIHRPGRCTTVLLEILEADEGAHARWAPAQLRTDAGPLCSPTSPRVTPPKVVHHSQRSGSLAIQDLHGAGRRFSHVHISFVLPQDNSGPFTTAAGVRARSPIRLKKRPSHGSQKTSFHAGPWVSHSSFLLFLQVFALRRGMVVHSGEDEGGAWRGLTWNSPRRRESPPASLPPRFPSLAQREVDGKGQRGGKPRLLSGQAARGCASGAGGERAEKLERTGPEAPSIRAARGCGCAREDRKSVV